MESRYAPDENLVQSENRRRAVGLKRLPVFSVPLHAGVPSTGHQGSSMYHKFNLSDYA